MWVAGGERRKGRGKLGAGCWVLGKKEEREHEQQGKHTYILVCSLYVYSHNLTDRQTYSDVKR